MACTEDEVLTKFWIQESNLNQRERECARVRVLSRTETGRQRRGRWVRCLGPVSHLPDELDLSTTDLLFEGEDDRDEEELEEEEEDVLE